ncbi:IclR family transcriptional regulator C-terminal domain-containing protein [Oceanobacillus luteolus]|uniref:IclR family transcriptional regulator C-terminal domain-containing protein n=1 Tax=Oceanobacillus luteolus TaxID=1274358 RepID=UPI00203CA162|nr:IclR family transcriptional regulator C-terminal domain-containing protein [Oceanobacillus luteolus]MCM3742464.1 IclR family transcriptional regulator C-terminal domain-containing protein [Oceanobacillus luteolus]
MAKNQVSTLKKGLLVLDLVRQRQGITLADLRSIYQVAQTIQMSTYLGKLDGTDLVMMQVLHEPFLDSADEEVGNRSKVHLSALGKVILAHLEEEKLNALLDKMALEPATTK